jgi:hypothetical protein
MFRIKSSCPHVIPFVVGSTLRMINLGIPGGESHQFRGERQVLFNNKRGVLLDISVILPFPSLSFSPQCVDS